jgi:hypothetical protein
MKGISFDLSRKSSGYAFWNDRTPERIGTVNLPAGFLGEQLSLWSAELDAILPTTSTGSPSRMREQ